MAQANPPLTHALASVGKGFAGAKPSAKLRAQMSRAGYYNPSAVWIYLGAKTLLLVLGVTFLVVTMVLIHVPAIAKVVLVMLGTGVLYFAPNMIVEARRRRRFQDIQSHLPDALDLLEVCVSAGMGLDIAWNAVADEIRRVSPMLADEMALTDLEMHLGAPRAVALRHMADRTGGQDVNSLVALMVQTERFGTSVAATLQTFAATMRDVRSQRAEEMAEKTAIKLILPMVLFIFPAALVVVVGPAAITLAKVLSGI